MMTLIPHLEAQPGVSDKTRIEVRLWASMRSQTVMRTVQGAVNYHIALEANPTIVCLLVYKS